MFSKVFWVLWPCGQGSLDLGKLRFGERCLQGKKLGMDSPRLATGAVHFASRWEGNRATIAHC